MKKLFAAATAALALSAGAAMADEMPIKGVCSHDGVSVVFNGSRMPIENKPTGEFGVTSVTMTNEDFNTLFRPHLHMFVAPPPLDKDGFYNTGIGELSVSIKEGDTHTTLRTSTSNFDLIIGAYIAPVKANGMPYSWKCDIKPNF